MTAKEYLNQAYIIDRRINITLRKIEKMRSALDYKSPQTENLGGSSGSVKDISETIAKIVDYENKCNSLVDILVDKRIEIDNAIQNVCDPVQREVLERRYLLCQPWENRTDSVTGEVTIGIAQELGYSRRRIFQIHGEALKKITIPKDCT